jgi:hypothetical protein
MTNNCLGPGEMIKQLIMFVRGLHLQVHRRRVFQQKKAPEKASSRNSKKIFPQGICPPERINTRLWKTMRYASGIFHLDEIFFFVRRFVSMIFAPT